MKRTLASSTALAGLALLGLGFATPAPAQIAADGTDCSIEANAELEACVALRGAAEPAPAVEPAPQTEPEPAPAAEPAPEPEPAPAVEAEPEPEPAPAAEPAPQPEPEPAPAVEPEPEPEPAPAAEPAPQPEPEPAPAAEPVPQPEPEPAPAVEPAPQPEPEPAPAAEPVPQPEPEPAPAVEPAPAAEAPAEPETAPAEAPPNAPEAEPIPAAEAVLPSEAPAVEEPAAPPAEASEIKGDGAAAEAARAAADAPARAVEIAVPTTVIGDNINADERARLAAEEQARREDARRQRDVLLGALAVGVVVGAIVPALGGTVVEDEGDRIIVERDGRYYVRKDESSLLRDGDAEIRVQRLPRGQTLETVVRRNGVQIVTLRDAGGFIISRSRILPDGTEIVLIDNTLVPVDDYIDLTTFPPPPPAYRVSARNADRNVIYRTFLTPPVIEAPRRFTLNEVRENREVRDLVPRVDLDSVTFETGSAFVSESQIGFIAETAAAAKALIAQDPAAVLLVEGHTDAVGSEVSNLALSDRRAETVARILTEAYGVPAENLIVQGYGEQFLKVNTQGPERANRRVTLRNISSLVAAKN